MTHTEFMLQLDEWEASTEKQQKANATAENDSQAHHNDSADQSDGQSGDQSVDFDEINKFLREMRRENTTH